MMAGTSRIGGIDAARALAIVGMVMVHIGPVGAGSPGIAGALYDLPHGRASVLFVLLAGVGVSLLAGDRSRGRLRSARAQLAWRAALLLPLGLWLQELQHGALVILQYYALYFVVAALAVSMRSRPLLIVSALLVVAGPVVYLGAWHAQPEWFTTQVTTLDDSPGSIARGLLLSGAYPLVTWSAPLLFGVWLGRQRLRSTRVRWRLIAGGAVVAVLAWVTADVLDGLLGFAGAPLGEPGWEQLIVDAPHSQMPLWVLGATGAATAVLGMMLVAADWAARALWPLVAMGQLALTIYVGHLLVLASWPWLLVRDEVGAALVVVGAFTLVVALASAVWRSWLARGPLEAVLRAPWLWLRGWRRTGPGGARRVGARGPLP